MERDSLEQCLCLNGCIKNGRRYDVKYFGARLKKEKKLKKTNMNLTPRRPVSFALYASSFV